MFLLLNKNIQFDQSFLINTGVDQFLKLPMANEGIEIPSELEQSLLEVL